MDPQQRIFLECAWEALELAGYDAERYEEPVGVFAGVDMNSYLFSNVMPNKDVVDLIGGYQTMIASDKDYLSTRVSYKLNLRGPSLTVQTACSTSLVAVHVACQSLLNGECRMALAGGVSVTVPHRTGYLYQEGGIGSPDGHCRTFDALARGTVGGSGVGVVVLKRLEDALADGDRVHAVIRGSAINNDGSDKVGYTAPSVEGQAKVISDALAMACVSPETITYVEAHGTATALGDPIEVSALTRAFSASTGRKQFCAVGSVKSNVGHLGAAAGVTGLIKTVEALKHGELPPSLHYREPNPRIDFASSPFYVNAALREWRPGAGPRRAGVSSFGIGGTNAHVVVEEAPARPGSGASREWQLLAVSARTPGALEASAGRLAAHLRGAGAGERLADVAFTLGAGRRAMRERLAVVCRRGEEAAEALSGGVGGAGVMRGAARGVGSGGVVMMFPGQGSQYAGMGAGLYEGEAVYRGEVERCVRAAGERVGAEAAAALRGAGGAGHAGLLAQTSVAQPALFITEYALAKQLLRWGVKAEGMIGHSLGEYVAACLAGVFSLEDALETIAFRGRLFEKLPEGAMLTVALSEAEARPFLDERLSVAAVNAPS